MLKEQLTDEVLLGRAPLSFPEFPEGGIINLKNAM